MQAAGRSYPSRLEQRVVDFERLEGDGEGLGSHPGDVFCCLGTTIGKAGSREAFRRVDFEYPYRVAQMAVRNGAEQFLLVSASGASPRSRVFYSRVKGELEEAVGRLPFRSVGYLRPSAPASGFGWSPFPATAARRRPWTHS